MRTASRRYGLPSEEGVGGFVLFSIPLMMPAPHSLPPWQVKMAYVNFVNHCYVDTEVEMKEIYTSNHIWTLFENFTLDMAQVRGSGWEGGTQQQWLLCSMGRAWCHQSPLTNKGHGHDRGFFSHIMGSTLA